MPRSRRSARRLLFLATGLSLASVASATTYTDATNDQVTGQNVAMDLASVVVTNDAYDLHVTINVNSTASLTSFPYGRYEMGIQVGNGAGGQTAINQNYNLNDPTAGNPYGTPAGISTGENFFIGSQVAGSSSGDTTGGATIFGYSTTNGWTTIDNTYLDVPQPSARFSSTATSLSYYFPLTDFGFTAGSTFNFDVWSTFSGAGNSAYDALDNPNMTPGYVGSTTTVYDAATATGSTFSTTSYTVVSSSLTANWNVDGGGSWNSATNWDVGVPNSPASTATFGSILDATHAPAIITVDANQSVGQITFNNINSYSITTSGGFSLTINDTGDSGGVNPLVTALAGNHSIAVPIFLNAGVTLNAAANSSLSISGDVSTDGIAGTGPVTVTGAGTVTLSGTNTYTGNTTVSSGARLNVGTSLLAGILPTTTTLSSSGITTFAANPGTGILAETLTGITIGSAGQVVVTSPTSGHGNRTVLSTGSLAITSGGTIDLGANDMIVHSGVNGEAVFGPVSIAGTIENEVAAARGTNGAWTGTGITSSAAKASPSNTALAVVLNDTNQSGTLSGTQLVTANPLFNSGSSTFDGQTIADGDVLVKYTYYGDALLTGSVIAGDYAQIDNAFSYNSAHPSTPLTGWYNGDFNYDGVVNGDDYTLIDNAFNSQGGVSFAGTAAGPAEMIAGDTEQVAGASSAAVPEPAALGLGGIAAGQLLLRRRRKT